MTDKQQLLEMRQKHRGSESFLKIRIVVMQMEPQ